MNTNPVRITLLASLTCFGLLQHAACSSDDNIGAPPPLNDGGGNPQPDSGAITLPSGTPKTTVLSGATLVTVQNQLAHGASAEQKKALTRLLQSADGYLTTGPWSVVDKQTFPPSQDKHDYMSQAPYWWPADATNPPETPGTAGDCTKGYYVQHDGIRNTREVDPPALTDRAGLHATIQGILHLSLAWYYTGDARYAQRAELFARHWFFDPDTAMNANMSYGQGIPCQKTPTLGRGTGIIEASGGYLSDLVDGLAILDLGAPGWTQTDQTSMRAWLSSFLGWLTTKQTDPSLADPISEAQSLNNHQTWYDSSVASLGAYLGKTDIVTTAIADGKARIDEQINAQGAQYRELARTQAWHYSIYNATALCRLAETSNQFGTNLWSYVGSGGGSLPLAFEYFVGGAQMGASGFMLNPTCKPPNASLTVATANKCSPTQVQTVPGDSPDAGAVPAFDNSEPYYDLRATAVEANDAKTAAAIPQAAVPMGVDMFSLIPSCRIVVAPDP